MTHEERMSRLAGAGLYLVTSAALSRGRDTRDIVRAALAGGVRLVQLREKDLPPAELLRLAGDVRRLTAEAGALLIINDRVDVALAVGADGVHLGQEDMEVRRARDLAPDLILGVSTHSVAGARAAEQDGASYINIGPIFPTRTKAWDRDYLGLEGLRRIAASVSLPFTVMGGIKREHIPDLVRAGARTIAMVTAVTAADDPEQAARDLLGELRCAQAAFAAAAGAAARPAEASAPAACRSARKILPAGLLVEGRRCLVVGGGPVAARKARALAVAGADVTLVAPRLSEAARGLAAEGVTLVPRAYAPGDLAPRPFLVFTVTDDPALNRAILDACHAAGILCACPDHGWEDGDLISPATFRAGDLTVSLSTGGAACRRARHMKEHLQQHADALGPGELFVAVAPAAPDPGLADALGELIGLQAFVCARRGDRVWIAGLASASPALWDAVARILGTHRCHEAFQLHREWDAFRALARVVAETPDWLTELRRGAGRAPGRLGEWFEYMQAGRGGLRTDRLDSEACRKDYERIRLHVQTGRAG